MRKVLRRIRRIARRRSNHAKSQSHSFKYVSDPQLGISRRVYDNYEHYLAHQVEKLSKIGEPLVINDQMYEGIVKERYSQVGEFAGKRVVCLAARLGGEVRAFKSLGALAIGIDLEPGPRNSHVVYGDFHDIPFPDQSFDIVFTNAIDHVFDLERFSEEVSRVLSPDGIFYIEMGLVKIGDYEVLDTRDPEPILKILAARFHIESQQKIRNTTNYTDWQGLLIKLSSASSREPAANL